MHGIAGETWVLSQILDQLKTFLDQNPSEVILLHQQRQDDNENASQYISAMNSMLNSYTNYLWTPPVLNGLLNPTLSDVRGKIVIYKDLDNSASEERV